MPGWKYIWEQFRRAFSGAKGFLGKMRVVVSALYALVMATIKTAVSDLKKTCIVLAAVIVGLVSISQLLRIGSDPTVALIIIGLGALGFLIWFLKKHFKEKAEAAEKKKAAVNDGKRVTGDDQPIKDSTWVNHAVIGAIALVLVVGTIAAIRNNLSTFSEWWLQIIGVITLIAVIIACIYKREAVKKLWRSEFLIVIAIAFGIATMNWLLWAFSPHTWAFIHADTLRFWSINFGAFVGLVMRLIPRLDKDNKVLEGTHPIAKSFSNVVLGMTFLTIGYMSWLANRGQEDRVQTAQVAPAAVFGQEAPMEVARQIICKNESGCRQYEEGTKIPFKNRGIPEEGVTASTASGKYQFTEAHWEKAKGLGFDPNTEEGQDKYFEWVWKNDGGTKHWENDPRGSFRWITELMSLGYGPWIVTEGLVTANPGADFGRKITIHPGIYFEWSTNGGPIEVIDQNGNKAKYDPQNGVNENLRYPSTVISFRSLGDKPVEVKLRFSRTPFVKMSRKAEEQHAPRFFVEQFNRKIGRRREYRR